MKLTKEEREERAACAARKDFAQRVKDAVDEACKSRRVASIGARIEELLGEPLTNYPDEIMPLDMLPTIDRFQFIGWNADFEPMKMEQAAVAISDGAATACIQVSVEGEEQCDFLVGWKPIRMAALEGRIQPA